MWAGATFAASSSDLPWDPTLHQAKSCTEVEAVMKQYLEAHWNAWHFGPLRGGMIMNDAATAEALNSVGGKWGGGWMDFSATNNQKAGVDEPEIIKNNGTTIYYIDSQKGVLRVLDPKTQKEITSMPLPKDYWGAQMLVQGNKLILVGNKSVPYNAYKAANTFVYHDQQVLVAVYSTENITPKLIKAYTFDGYLQDSRVVNNELILITSQWLNRQPVYTAVSDMVNKNTTKAVNIKDFSVSSKDVMPTWNTLTSVTKKLPSGKNLTLTRSLPSGIDCTQFMYRKPDQQQKWMGYYGGEALTSIVRLPLQDANPQAQVKTILANSSQIHVSADSLYLTTPSYVYTPFSCPVGAMCLPWRGEGQYTTVYGFNVKNLAYKYATIVDGNTWNQYSMDENSNGTFRMVTSSWRNNKNSTNVYTIWSDGKILGQLENIAPGEQFHGVRFIGDYLYLVTYRQIDPLFAISTADEKKPTIVWELKMPGYSTYLHPYGVLKNGVQYLIWLGYSTKILPEGGELQEGIKLDLYKVDYNKKNAKGQVEVSQVWTKTYGEAGSQSEALYNPRLFVLNQNTSELILPIVTAITKKIQSCNTRYDQWNELRKECYMVDQPITTFAGLKSWNITENGLSEWLSIDYSSLIKQPYYGMEIPVAVDNMGWTWTGTKIIDPRVFSSLMPRVGYNGDQYYFISSQFTHFFTKANTNGTYVNYK